MFLEQTKRRRPHLLSVCSITDFALGVSAGAIKARIKVRRGVYMYLKNILFKPRFKQSKWPFFVFLRDMRYVYL